MLALCDAETRLQCGSCSQRSYSGGRVWNYVQFLVEVNLKQLALSHLRCLTEELGREATEELGRGGSGKIQKGYVTISARASAWIPYTCCSCPRRVPAML